MYTVLVSLLRLVCAVSLAAILRLASDSFRVRGVSCQQPCVSPHLPTCSRQALMSLFLFLFAKLHSLIIYITFFFRKYANFAVQSFAQFVNK